MAQDFGYLEFKIVGASEVLQSKCTDFFLSYRCEVFIQTFCLILIFLQYKNVICKNFTENNYVEADEVSFITYTLVLQYPHLF